MGSVTRSSPHADLEAGEPGQRIRPLSRSEQWTLPGVAHVAAVIASILIAATLISPATAHAENAFVQGSQKVFDLIIVRPLGVGKLAFGFVCFLPAGLFASTPTDLYQNGWASSDASSAWDLFVATPFQETFQTPLGEIEQ